MYTRLTRFRIHAKLASSAYLGLGIILPITSNALPYMSGTRIPCLLGVKNYLNNYFAYKRLSSSRKRVELASPAYLGFGII